MIRPEKIIGRKKEFQTTVSGNPVKRVYTTSDIKDGQNVEMPGEYPYTRGISPTGYRTRLWTMRMYSGFGTVQDTNRRYKYLYKQGQTGFSIAFHLPTQEGYDSDNPLTEGEVGRCGVAIDTLRDMEELWDGIPISEISTSMTINATASIMLAMYVVAAGKQGADLRKINGTVQNDILKEYIARNTYFLSPGPSMRLVTDVCEYCTRNLPQWNPISISGYHMREAGATAVQEVAFALSNAIEYAQALLDKGIAVDDFAPRLSFFFAANNNVLEEVAKYRAARRMWAKIMKERFSAKNPRSLMLRFHAQTDGFTLTAQQPLNNIARVTLQALAAVLGGCQSLHTNSFDEAMALPTEQAVQVALRTQQIIAHESGVTDTIDPLGGSYFVEALTQRIEEEASKYIAEIDRMGGAIKAIGNGYVQREIARSSYEYQQAVESGEHVIVGLNEYRVEEEPDMDTFEVDVEIEAKQQERLRTVKKERDGRRVKETIDAVKTTARSSGNLMPVFIEAVKAYATIGEISGALREVFGEYREPNIL
jgi:methylmalonyl-CoA mutase N-terminal domain/subunit